MTLFTVQPLIEKNPNDLVSWQTFGGAHISSLYPTEVDE